MSRNRITRAFVRTLLVLLVLLFAGAFPSAPEVYAAPAAEVSSEEELLRAVSDDTVSAIALTVPSVVLSEGFSVNRNISFSGAGGTLILETDAQIKVAQNCTAVFSDIRIQSTEGYSVSCYGNIEFGDNVTIAGDYGVLMNGGARITSGGRAVNVEPSVGRAIGISAQNGQVSLADISISQTSGSTHLVYLHQSAGVLSVEGTVNLSSNNSNAIMCPNNGSNGPTVMIRSGAKVSIYAPGASNTGGSAEGSAIDTKNGVVTIEDYAVVELTGSDSAIYASHVVIGNGVRLNISCNTARRKSAAIYSLGGIEIGEGAAINIGANEETGCGGFYAPGGFSAGNSCQILIRCRQEAENVIYSGTSVAFGDDISLNIRGGKNGIVCKNGVVTGNRCTVEITEVSGYGVKSTGKLIPDKLYFGPNNTLTIDADYCTVYSCEAFHIDKGSRAQLSCGTKAPALWIAADKDSPGYISVVDSSVTVVSGAGASADINSGVYVVGAMTIEDNAVFYSENSSDFSVTVMYGDVNVSSGASMYVRSGCGLYVMNGDVRLSSGGSLFSQGLRDSAVRVDGGVINIGDKAVVDLQGARFGAEVLGEGGLWISGAYSYDIRSTGDRAVYIENGSISIDSVERVSVWGRAGEGEDNSAVWWTGADETAASWEITASDSGVVQNYADHTRLAPSGMQNYQNGEPVDTGTLDWYGTAWNMYDYSRIGMYKSRPTARANTFNIPAGRSFSWWLYGESYDGSPATYQIYSSAGDGEFELSEDGRFTYTAPAYVRGKQSFMFTVTNGEGVTSEPAEIKIHVTASKAPIVYSATFMTEKNEQLLGQLNVRDYDGAISDTIVSKQPSNGTLTISSDGKFLYVPAEDFVGMDEFEFYAVDDYGDSSNTGYVTIVVGAENGIIAGNDTYATDSGTLINASLVLYDAAGVTSASDAAGGDGLEYVITERPKYGTFSVSADGLVTYTPYEDFAGADMFRYYVEGDDGSRSNEAIVTIAIIPSKRPMTSDGYFTCAKNYYCEGTLKADDIDGSVIRYELLSSPESGTLTLNDVTGEFRYEPTEDYLGLVMFTFSVMDDDGLVSSEGVVYIEVLTLINNLKVTGKLTGVIIAGIGIITAVTVLTVMLITAAAKRHRRELIEMQEYYQSMGYYDDRYMPSATKRKKQQQGVRNTRNQHKQRYR